MKERVRTAPIAQRARLVEKGRGGPHGKWFRSRAPTGFPGGCDGCRPSARQGMKRFSASTWRGSHREVRTNWGGNAKHGSRPRKRMFSGTGAFSLHGSRTQPSGPRRAAVHDRDGPAEKVQGRNCTWTFSSEAHGPMQTGRSTSDTSRHCFRAMYSPAGTVRQATGSVTFPAATATARRFPSGPGRRAARLRKSATTGTKCSPRRSGNTGSAMMHTARRPIRPTVRLCRPSTTRCMKARMWRSGPSGRPGACIATVSLRTGT